MSPATVGDRVRANDGSVSALATGSALGWIHDVDSLGAWILWDTGHTSLEAEVDLMAAPFTPEQRADFQQAQRLVWEQCDYFRSGWWTSMPMVNPNGRALCDDPSRCPAHRDPPIEAHP